MLKQSSRSLFMMFILASGALLIAQSAQAQANQNAWRWSFTPYIWMSDTTSKLSINDRSIAESTLEFGDVIDNLDVGFQGHLEGHRGHFGFFADLTYLAVSDGTTQQGFQIDTEIDTGIYELAAIYNPAAAALEGFAVFGGVRYMTMDLKVDLQGEGPLGLQHTVDQDSNLTDFMFGARYGARLSDHWELGLRGDYSTGDTDGTWNLIALIGYRFQTQSFTGSALLGYRYMQMDYKDDPVDVENTMSGPLLGFRFDF